MKTLNIVLKKGLWGLVSLFLMLSLSFFILSFIISPFGNILSNYFAYLVSIITFKFGWILNTNNANSFDSVSYFYNFYFAKSLLLIIPSFVVSFLFGIVFGSASAYIKNKYLDNFIVAFLHLFSSLPIFILAPILIIYSEQINWPSLIIEPGEYALGSVIQSLFFPNLLIFVVCVSFFALKVKESTSQVLNQTYIKFARAKGVSEIKIFFNHVLKNSFVNFASSITVLYAFVLSYSIIVERVFQLQGQSIILINAFDQGEMYLILYFIFSTVISIIVFQLFIELILVWANPVYKDNVYQAIFNFKRRQNA
ncbi:MULTISPECIES: ABC transporter permease [unclassified Mycoplasma]|uniref:ABC transporter permease subunit n=1 Tax=unclassified Mycoplasma TaxID=2683645 RepID=UPI00211CDF85|nr:MULTISPECIES: ABC transporter permease [unclassified Mycoplasma]UUM19625.1 ABC transporter permease [Mycoplasma sp. 1578d]UUM24594.1 ABC transporter permease [Mycoplasma sp. 3686d]